VSADQQSSDAFFARLLCDIMIPAEISAAIRAQLLSYPTRSGLRWEERTTGLFSYLSFKSAIACAVGRYAIGCSTFSISIPRTN
jgi:hypothetical protein